MTLKVEPGCLVESVARLSVSEAVFVPRPPRSASTCPFDWSMMTMEDWGCGVTV